MHSVNVSYDKSMRSIIVKWTGVLAVTRFLLLWHSANRATRAFRQSLHRRLFALSTCRTAVSPFPIRRTLHHKCVTAISGWTFRFCSVAKPLGLPLRSCNSACERSFLNPEGSMATHQLTSPVVMYSGIK
jgi:hypothetical protein